MNKLMDRLLSNIKFDKKYVLFSLIIVLFGIITGALFIVILNGSDKIIVKEYIEEFVTSISKNTYTAIDLYKNASIVNIVLLIIMFVVGLTYFLFIINILILYYKSFIIGFSISSFILTYQFKGIFLSIIYVFPNLIINILIFVLITAYTVKLSISMIKNIINKKSVYIGVYFKKYLCLLIISILIVSITAVYEAIIIPKLIKYISHFL